MTKYEPLGHYLDLQSRTELILAFADVESILGTSLPPSAFKYREWWANETNLLTTHSQCGAWMSVGYHAFPNIMAREVRFVRKPVLVPSTIATRVSGIGADPAKQEATPQNDTVVRRKSPMLLAFGGLPGVGKTTIARQVTQACGAVHLHIDEIEQTIRSANEGGGDPAALAYAIAHVLAETCLRAGNIVVVDCINLLAGMRNAWRATAASTDSPIVEIEIVCSDPTKHRHRVERRISEIPGRKMPSWVTVIRQAYEPWPERHLMINTARESIDEAVNSIFKAMHPFIGEGGR